MTEIRADSPKGDYANAAQRPAWIWCLLILVMAALSNYPLILGQMHGDDEAGQMFFCRRIISLVSHWHGKQSFIDFGWLFLQTEHPPLRFLLSLPGVILFPGTEFGLRMMAILFSLVMTWQAMKLGRELGGLKVGLASGLLLACSAIYNWTSIAFGWSVIVTALLLCVRRLRVATFDLSDAAERRTFRTVNLLLIAAFLVNTSAVLFVAATGFLYLWANRRRLLSWLKATAPFLAFYVAYYGFFLIAYPWACRHFLGMADVKGQVRQTLGRAAQAHLNCSSFLEDIQAVNGHFLPYVGLVFIALGLYQLLIREKRILLWLSLFMVAWSFYLTMSSQSYFLLGCICIVPFGVQFLAERLKPVAFIVMIAGLAAGFAAWNYALFIRPYPEAAYPHGALEWGYAIRGYENNVREPYKAIGADLDAILGDHDKFVTDIEGSFTMFYYKDAPMETRHTRYAGYLGGDKFPLTRNSENGIESPAFDGTDNIRAIVTKRRLSSPRIVRIISHPPSRIRVYVLSSARTDRTR